MFGIDDAVLASVGTGVFNQLMAGNRQDTAQEFSAGQFATRYQTSVEDMKKAGLNPMLAYSQGPGSAPSSSAASATTPDVGSTMNQSKLVSAQMAKLNAEIENIEADTLQKRAGADNLVAQAGAAGASADQSRANIGLIEHNVKKIQAELENIPREGDRLVAAANALWEQAELSRQKGMTEPQVRDQITATIGKIFAESDLLNFDIQAAQALDNIGRKSKELKPIVDAIRGFTRK